MLKHKLIRFSLILALILALPAMLAAEFYKYVDKDGNVYFVDDLSKVPEEYRPSVDKYREKYDHLSNEERARRLEQDRRDQQGLESEHQEQLEQELQAIREREEAERQRQAEIESRNKSKKYETKIVIDGNRILVPVTLVNTGIEVNTMLLLDTGASQIVLFREIADRLNFIAQQKGVAQVAGGNTIYSELGRVDSFRVGPIAMRNVGVLVINHEGPPLKHSGMLGMTFLRNLEYSIDFKNQVIRWRPPAK